MSKVFEREWSYEKIKNGCILSGIAHAIAVAKFPEISYEHSWDGINYNIQNSEGIRGTITFGKKLCVAAFRNEDSERISKNPSYYEYFNGAPSEVLELAEAETLQYLLENLNSTIQPVITTAFWGNQSMHSNDTVEEFMKNGGNIIFAELLDTKNAVEYWSSEYEFSKEEKQILEDIYQRRGESYTGKMFLNQEEDILLKRYSEEGYQESIESFKEMNIIAKY